MITHKLKELREKFHFSQTELAEKLDIAQQTYSNYENGTNELPIRHLITLAEIYDVSTDFILERTTYPKLNLEVDQPYVTGTSLGSVLPVMLELNSPNRSHLYSYLSYMMAMQKKTD